MRLSRSEALSVGAICQAGFTLVEVMVVIAIIAILAAIAYPSYQETVRKGKRAEGRSALMQLMQQQEQYYSQHNSYIKFDSSSAGADEKRFKWYSGNSSAQSAYEISGDACDGYKIENCVLLVAKPGMSKVDDPVCGTISMDSIGNKSPSGTDCWK